MRWASIWWGSVLVGSCAAAAGPGWRFELDLDSGPRRLPLVLQLQLQPPAPGSTALQLSGQADLAALDGRLVELLNEAIGPRRRCQAQVRVRRAWFDVATPGMLALEMRGEFSQPLCDRRVERLLGSTLPAARSPAHGRIELHPGVAGGRPRIRVGAVELWTGRDELDLLLAAWLSPSELRRQLQLEVDAALGAWPPPPLQPFRPRLQQLRLAPGTGLGLQFGGSIEIGWQQWLELSTGQGAVP